MAGAPASKAAAADTLARLSVADLLALRSLTRRPGGLSLDKLNAGAKEARRKKDKKAAAPGDTEEEKWRLQMERGGLVSKATAAER